MRSTETIYILGAGAVGFPLALYLARAGRRVVAVRTSHHGIAPGPVTVRVQHGDEQISARVDTVSLDQLDALNGLVLIAAKAHANDAIARVLQAKSASGPLVLMQNGVGIEKPFFAAGFAQIYRCILYVTGQTVAPYTFSFRPVASSPVGIVRGDEAGLRQSVDALVTDGVPFHAEANIQREIWKKVIINAVFNSICPLLDADNGIFARDPVALELATEIVQECVALTERLDIEIHVGELLAQIQRVSQGSDGQLISTLQDIRNGRPTEIEFLNLEIARIAAALQPPLPLPKTDLLGKMIVAKSIYASTTTAIPPA